MLNICGFWTFDHTTQSMKTLLWTLGTCDALIVYLKMINWKLN